MKRAKLLSLLALTLLSAASCAAAGDMLAGESQGYAGPVRVLVQAEDGKLRKVEVTAHQETQGVGTRAIDLLPRAMEEAGTWEVEAVSGATVTSHALMDAVRQAMQGPATDTDAAPVP